MLAIPDPIMLLTTSCALCSNLHIVVAMEGGGGVKLEETRIYRWVVGAEVDLIQFTLVIGCKLAE